MSKLRAFNMGAGSSPFFLMINEDSPLPCASFAFRNLLTAVLLENVPGHANFSFNEQEAGWATLIDDMKTEHSETKVNVIRLDDWVQERRIARVDFMKLDIEGGECHALQGAQQVLRKFRPQIVAEIKPGFWEEELFALLSSLQYSWVPFRDGVLATPR